MDESLLSTPPQVSVAVQELDQLANELGMPNAERYGILGLSGGAYRSWQVGIIDIGEPVAPELLRRLSYALRLMRRMAANKPVTMTACGRGRAHLIVN